MDYNVLYGVHLGEHGFDAESVEKELRSYKALGYNFITIRPKGGALIEEKYYIRWAKYLAENKMYFIFLYAIQYPPKGERCHLKPETVLRIKEIAGKYFLGDMLGETGSSHACKLPGYYNEKRIMPGQNCRNMQEAKNNFSDTVRGFVEIGKETGFPALASVEATMLNNYNVECGVSMPFAEIPCANPEIVLPALRGTARAYGCSLWGTYIAHEWYAGMRHFDSLKQARMELCYKYSYLMGSMAFCLESGLGAISSYGVDLPADNEIAKKNSEIINRFAKFALTDKRPEGGPISRIAFVQGNLDSYAGGWGGGYSWSQFKDEWAISDAENSWRIIGDVNSRRSWWEVDSYETRGLDTSGNLGAGYDIIPATSPLESMNEYDCLIFTGWNTMTEQIYSNLTEYVRRGGKLLITAAHLNMNSERRGKPLYPDTEELLGCRLTGESVPSGLGHRFVADSDIDGVKYPFPRLCGADPIYSRGTVNYAVIDPCGCSIKAMLSDSFLHNPTPMAPTVVEHTLGRGKVILLTSSDYPGNNAVYPLYRSVALELIRSAMAESEIKVLSAGAVVSATYADGVIYLLNTDHSLPMTAVLLPESEEPLNITLAPLELCRCVVENGKARVERSV